MFYIFRGLGVKLDVIKITSFKQNRILARKPMLIQVRPRKKIENSLIAVVMKYAGREKAALLPVLTDSEAEGTTAF